MKLYSTPACWHCNQLKKELIDRGIDFELMDLDDDKVRDEALELIKQTGKDELPIVVKDGKIFNNPKIEDLIN